MLGSAETNLPLLTLTSWVKGTSSFENEPDERKYGVGGWRFEQLQGEGEELDDCEDGDECDEDGQPLNILIIYDNDIDNIWKWYWWYIDNAIEYMKTVNPEEMPLVLLGQSSPSRSQGIVPTWGESFFKQSMNIYIL